MRVIFRVDGSKEIGMGHIVRCLALADGLRDGKLLPEVLFITRHEEGKRAIEERQYKVIAAGDNEITRIGKLANTETLLITDFLDTDGTYVSRIKETAKSKVICIDNNTHLKEIHTDIVIDANVFDEGDTKAIGSTRYYLGPKYMILRKEFELAHAERKKIKDKVGTILVMSGGADSAGRSLILNSVKALRKIGEEIGVHLVIGPAFPYKDELNDLLSKTDKHFHVSCNPLNLLDIMKSADMAITAAGITLYEMAALGVPSVSIPQVTSETRHQEDIANAFERHGACLNLGNSPGGELIYERTMMLMEDKSLRGHMSDNGKALVDGKGLGRAVALISELCHQIRQRCKGI